MSWTLQQSQARCSRGRVLLPHCSARVRCRRPCKCPISYPTSRSNAEEFCFPPNPSAIPARCEWGFDSQQARDSHTQCGHTNTDLALQQPSRKALNTLLVSSPYLTTTSQQTTGTATEKPSVSSLLCRGSPVHSATHGSFERTAGSTPCLSLLPQQLSAPTSLGLQSSASACSSH